MKDGEVAENDDHIDVTIENLTFRVHPELQKELQEKAAEHKTSVSHELRKLIEHCLGRLGKIENPAQWDGSN